MARTTHRCLPAATPAPLQLVFGVRHSGGLTLPSTMTSYPLGAGDAAVQEKLTVVFGVRLTFDGDCATGAVLFPVAHGCAKSGADTPPAMNNRKARRRMDSPLECRSDDQVLQLLTELWRGSVSWVTGDVG